MTARRRRLDPRSWPPLCAFSRLSMNARALRAPAGRIAPTRGELDPVARDSAAWRGGPPPKRPVADRLGADLPAFESIGRRRSGRRCEGRTRKRTGAHVGVESRTESDMYGPDGQILDDGGKAGLHGARGFQAEAGDQPPGPPVRLRGPKNSACRPPGKCCASPLAASEGEIAEGEQVRLRERPRGGGRATVPVDHPPARGARPRSRANRRPSPRKPNSRGSHPAGAQSRSRQLGAASLGQAQLGHGVLGDRRRLSARP